MQPPPTRQQNFVHSQEALLVTIGRTLLFTMFLLRDLTTEIFISTVPLKCKLTVSTRYSIFDPRSFRELRVKFRGSSFEFRGSRAKFRGSSFEFRETVNLHLSGPVHGLTTVMKH